MRQLSKKIHTALILILSLMVVGCGFHLRGWNESLPPFLQNIYINAGNNYNFYNILKTDIQGYGAKVVDQQDLADVAVKINSAQQGQQLVGISGGASSNDYILSFTVNYDIIDARNQAVIFSNQVATAQQNFTSNATLQLAADQQQQMIYNDLQKRVASSILTRLATLKPEDFSQAVEKEQADIKAKTATCQSCQTGS